MVCTLKIRRSPTAALTERSDVFAGQGRGDAVRRRDAGCERRRAEVISTSATFRYRKDQAGPHRIFHDVLLFDVVAFLRSQDVIKKFPLRWREARPATAEL